MKIWSGCVKIIIRIIQIIWNLQDSEQILSFVKSQLHFFPNHIEFWVWCFPLDFQYMLLYASKSVHITHNMHMHEPSNTLLEPMLWSSSKIFSWSISPNIINFGSIKFATFYLQLVSNYVLRVPKQFQRNGVVKWYK